MAALSTNQPTFWILGANTPLKSGGQTFSVQIRSGGFGFRYELLKSGDAPTYERMARELRSWAIWLLAGGLITVLAARTATVLPTPTSPVKTPSRASAMVNWM